MRAPAVPVTYIWIRYGDAQPVIHDFNATTEEIPAECRRVADALANEPFSVVTYDRAERFLNNVVAPISGCLLLPSDLAGIKARALITQIRRRKLSLPIIVVGRNSDLAVAVEIVRAGATDFLEQQFSHRDLRAMIRRAMRKIS